MYSFSNEHLYRREWFGGVLYSQRTKEIRFYNHIAALVIESFLEPSTHRSALESAERLGQDPRSINRFIEALINEEILVELDGEPGELPQRSTVSFFTDTIDFAEDRLHAPIGIEFELTLRCMRRCLYCAYESNPEVQTDHELTRETYRGLFAKLASSGVFYLRFTGGDPLTRPDTLDILRDADTHHFGLAVASDLTAFNEAQGVELSKLRNLVTLQTTLDGPTAAVADHLRGPGNFRRVTQGLEILSGLGVPLVVGTIVSKNNVNSIYDTAKYLSRWNISWCVSPLYSGGRGAACASLIPDDDDLTIAYEQFAAAIAEGLVRPADPGWQAIASPLGAEARSRLWAGQPWLVRSPDRVMRVDPTGRCYTSIHLKQFIGEQIYIGSVLETDLLSIWNEAPLLNNLRARRQQSSYFGDVVDIRTLAPREEVLR